MLTFEIEINEQMDKRINNVINISMNINTVMKKCFVEFMNSRLIKIKS